MFMHLKTVREDLVVVAIGTEPVTRVSSLESTSALEEQENLRMDWEYLGPAIKVIIILSREQKRRYLCLAASCECCIVNIAGKLS